MYRFYPISVFLLFFSQIAFSDSVCPHDVNAEWPVVPEMVCQPAEPATGAALQFDDGGYQTGQHPICERDDSDPDADGWGWENNRSCQVDKVGPAVCEFASSDPDGDGWGWENEQSCRISAEPVNRTDSCQSRLSDPDGDGWGFENGASCRVTAETPHPECSVLAEDPDGDGWGYENDRSCLIVKGKRKVEIVFEQNFEDSPLGFYTAQQLNEDWNNPLWHLGFVQERVKITEEPQRGHVMTVTYPASKYGAAGAAAFLSDLEFALDLPGSYEELYLSYDIKFGEGIEFVKGGKLPGLCGYDNTSVPVTGCNTGGGYPDGFDGWSARGMWRQDGVLENYVYHSAQENYYGDDLYWQVSAEPGKWHRVQHRVFLNTPDVANGILEAWLDGTKVLSMDNMMYRKTADIGINLFYFSTFYGGNDPSWAPAKDQRISFDNFVISTLPDAAGPLLADAQQDEGGNEFIAAQVIGSGQEPASAQALGKALSLNDAEDEPSGSAQSGSSGGGVVSGLTMLWLLLTVPGCLRVRRKKFV